MTINNKTQHIRLRINDKVLKLLIKEADELGLSKCELIRLILGIHTIEYINKIVE